MSYDSKCYELAEHFLSEISTATESDKNDLAQYLQTLCEDFCEKLEEKQQNLPKWENTKRSR